MNLVLTRRWFTADSTIGDLTVDGVWQCFILEDRYPRPYVKTPGKTAIPEGKYVIELTHSPRFGVVMPLLRDVPGFEGVRIHSGNTAADTEGCLLPGRWRLDNKVTDSRKAYHELFVRMTAAKLAGEKLTIEIRSAK